MPLGKHAHIWYFNTSSLQSKLDTFYKLLSEDEKNKANQFKFKKDKDLSILSRGALRVLLAHYIGVDSKKIVFSYNQYGKPYYNHRLKFNVSHSGNMVALGFVLDYDIGIDIEKIKNNFDVLDIAANYFSEKEISELKSLPKSKHVEAFYKCWTRKESFIKAKSIGLSFPLDQFSVSISSNKQVDLLETKWDMKEVDLWSIFSFAPASDYIGAISVKGKIKDIKILTDSNLLRNKNLI